MNFLQIYLPIAGNSVSLLLLLGLGGLVGLLSGLFGVGGGFLLTPLLIMIGIPPTVAAASDSNQIVAAASSGTFAHSRSGNVDFKMGILLLLGGLAGGTVGVQVIKILRAMAVYWVAYNYLRSEEDLRFFLMVLAAMVALQFLLVLQDRMNGIYRAKGSTPHSNTLAMYINMMNMIFLAFVLGDRGTLDVAEEIVGLLVELNRDRGLTVIMVKSRIPLVTKFRSRSAMVARHICDDALFALR